MLIREKTEQLEELTLSPFAQKSKDTKGRELPLAACPVRTEYQRDRDRIIHAKSFRRLKHKTQVFLSPEGDHYRTRLTHTLEVAQIARTIAGALRLNNDLTEAIALGHDLGHTPFGHSGEAILNKISSFGFKHYEQSLRVVELLEGSGGLNLTYEVRDGIVNHAGDNEAETLEGRIIKLADRIAYINHDIDDAVRGGVICEEDLPKECVEILGDSHGDRINALILDVVENSEDKPDILMSAPVKNAMMQLRNFMFERVYTSSIAKKEEEKAKNILQMLFETFMKEPEKLPADDFANIETMGTERVVIDYIAGMTDNFAVYKFNELFVPKSWSLR
ncbi:MAG: deoxyguanosinetriphosphate triphosphohydrolase [Clostridia bacterium]|nr:deoxyguanosinetriphosphate triphosphohydrolase [Clostridia bacterium]MBQ3554376.1 deoxyguanosinetriphosphate triphosphohydrolase [Clostridia bacterium]